MRGSVILMPLSSRRKWSKRGRGLGDFLASLLFSVSEHIVDFLIFFARKAWSGTSCLWRMRQLKMKEKPIKVVSAAQPASVPQKVAEVHEKVIFAPVDKSLVGRFTFSDVIGLEKAKDQVRKRVIMPLKDMAKAKALDVPLGGGVLLYGPPGNGKTLLAKAVANELDATFFHVTPADIVRQGVGVSECRLRELFIVLRRHKVCILFIDDIDGLLPSRSANNSTIMRRIIGQYLVETDGLMGKSDESILLIIGATNEPGMIDPAIRRAKRFDVRVYVGLPEESARQKILVKKMNGVPQSGDIDFARVAVSTSLFSGADLEVLVDTAKQKAFYRSVDLPEDEVSSVCMDDFTLALSETSPSVSEKDLRRYKE